MPFTNTPTFDLKKFYGLMEELRNHRFHLVQKLLDDQSPSTDDLKALRSIESTLTNLPGEHYKKNIEITSGQPMLLDLTYELTEIRRDLLFLEQEQETFWKEFTNPSPQVTNIINNGVTCLRGKVFRNWITDRDGTLTNYCGRYASSIQSLYNAIAVSRFHQSKTEHSIILTSAPLRSPGVVDVSVVPSNSVIFAGSKGREFLDLQGNYRSFPISPVKERMLKKLNHELSQVVSQSAYEKFSFIGSGLQFKFGQSAIARQDINTSIPSHESNAFLSLIRNLVATLDPDGSVFRIEDTGLDIEIILTIDDAQSDAKDFDKGDGVHFLNRELALSLDKGPTLVCGDTASDIPMLEAALNYCPNNTWSVFVTQNQELAARIRTVCPHAVIVPNPDCLIAILQILSHDTAS